MGKTASFLKEGFTPHGISLLTYRNYYEKQGVNEDYIFYCDEEDVFRMKNNVINRITVAAIDTSSIKEVNFSDSLEIILNYLADESCSLKGQAERVYFPLNEAEVSFVLKKANELGTPVTVSGGGTGITGSRVPLEGVVLSTEKLIQSPEKIPAGCIKSVGESGAGTVSLILNPETHSIIVPPAILLDDLYKMLEEYNLFYPPNPTELSATVGGNIATNASGGRSFKFGAIRNWIRSLRVILPTGELLEIHRGEVFAVDNEFIVEYPDGKAVMVPVPSYKMPQVKNASGYYADSGMDFIDLFIGAEGTLGLVTLAEIEVISWEDEIFSCILFFENEKNAVNFICEARELSRCMEELMDALTLDYFDVNSLEFMRKSHGDIPEKAGAAIFGEQLLPTDPDEVLCVWMDLMEKHQCIEDWTAVTHKDHERLRLFRHSLPESVNELMRNRHLKKMGMDLAVPDHRLEDIMAEYHRAGRENDLDYVLFGHIGNNNLHMNFLPKSEAEMEKIRTVYLDLARKGIAMGGTISAEHGVGKKRITIDGEEFPYLYLMYGKEGLKSSALVKRSLDPSGILNVGNIMFLS